MTSAQIRKATPFPKPRGKIAKATGEGPAKVWRRNPTRLQLAMFRHIAEHGDLIDRPIVDQYGTLRGAWLLVPLPSWMVDKLCEFEAHLADLEPDEGDYEPDVDNEAVGWSEGVDQTGGRENHVTDDEESLGSSEQFSQLGWAVASKGWGAGREADDSDSEPSLGAPEQVNQAPSWARGASDDREDDPDGLGEAEVDCDLGRRWRTRFRQRTEDDHRAVARRGRL